ncbi:MAG: hypothetical protein N2036_09475 [Bryobacteraceae bacterium]|nr:hypothetical protein [Bryobacteraceae bacterium]MCX7604292.1 hypothetical protein [Bryobacteraceae bacterium]
MTTPIIPRNARADAGADVSAAPSQGSRPGETGTDRLASKEVFLQLLVAQIRNQNPLNPADGTEFVAQLAQFSQLEATLAIRKDLGKIREVLAPEEEGAGPAVP